MYTLLCSGGYPVPEKDGQLDIIGIKVMPSTAGTAMACILRDDNQSVAPTYTQKNAIVGLKSDGNRSECMEFDPPLKTRKGLRATTLTNCVAYVYTR